MRNMYLICVTIVIIVMQVNSSEYTIELLDQHNVEISNGVITDTIEFENIQQWIENDNI